MKNIKNLKIKIFSDGADLNEMLDMNKKDFIHGMTTNPSLMISGSFTIKLKMILIYHILGKITILNGWDVLPDHVMN